MSPEGPRPLVGRVALVTGVSRRRGIGFAIADRLLADGATVFLQSWAVHDGDQAWGADPEGPAALTAALGASHDAERVDHLELDLADRSTPADLVDATIARFGAIDMLVANHARSSSQDLIHLTAEEIDLSFAVNARATVLLAQAFAARHDDGRRGGRIVLFTSGQDLGPMPEELPYVLSKGAIHQVTMSLAAALAGRAITVNAVNPGPTDTGWVTGERHRAIARRFPDGYWNEPSDAAAVVAWLVSDDARRITGQIIDAEGGFRR